MGEEQETGLFSKESVGYMFLGHKGQLGDDMWRWIWRSVPEMRDLKPSEIDDQVAVDWTFTNE